jgi:multiple sugar transport system ATP-binding protein
MARVELKNVYKTYAGDVQAVKDANLVIDDREFVVLVGPSGCGKSTTLRMIAGLEEISSGEIYIGDRLVNDVPPKDRDIAMVFQNYALYPHMTVYKNMSFGLMLRKYPKKEIDERVRQAAEILKITELLDRRPKALSGGQRQRVAVGRAIVRHPQVFLFDEPLSNLDAKLRVQMRAEISKLHTQLQSTMIYVTHDQVEAMTMGDRIVVMLDGVIQQIASPLELYHEPVNRFVAGFIGSPPMNFIEGRLEASGERILFKDATGNVNLEAHPEHRELLGSHVGGPVTLGIRPEHFVYNPQQQPHDGQSLHAQVEVVEPMGSEIYVHLEVHGQTLTARLDTDDVPVVEAPYIVDIDMERAHYFDASTEEALVHRPVEAATV